MFANDWHVNVEIFLKLFTQHDALLQLVLHVYVSALALLLPRFYSRFQTQTDKTPANVQGVPLQLAAVKTKVC